MARESKGPRVYQRGGRLWGEWRNGHGGKVRQALRDGAGRTLPITAPESEIQRAVQWQYKNWSRSVGRTGEEEAKAPGTVIELTDAYVAAYGDQWDVKTVKQYRNWIGDIVKFLGADSPLRSVSPARALQLQKWLRGRSLATKTINMRIAFARQLFQWAMDFEHTDRNVGSPGTELEFAL